MSGSLFQLLRICILLEFDIMFLIGKDLNIPWISDHLYTVIGNRGELIFALVKKLSNCNLMQLPELSINATHLTSIKSFGAFHLSILRIIKCVSR